MILKCCLSYSRRKNEQGTGELIMIQTVTVEKEFSGNRVDKFLSEQFSRSFSFLYSKIN